MRTPKIDDPCADFNVVIAYEDFETGTHAKKIYDFLREHLKGECRFNSQMWKFDVLTVSKLREMAVKDASQADVIIISAHGNSDLPSDVKAWIESWLMEPGRVIALVGLFGSNEYLNNPARAYLTRAAKRAGVEFFAQPGMWPNRDHSEDHPFGPWAQNNRTFSLLANVMQQDKEMSRWEINE